jgi:glycosyltransferase involved in cell wall biosynthesis
VSRNILLFKDVLLGPSETFILEQAEALSRFRAFYVGARRVPGIDLPADRSFFINDGGRRGRCRELLFKAFDFLSAGQLARLARVEPALVHAHFGPAGVLALSLAGPLGLPLLVTFHGFDATWKDRLVPRSCYTHRKYLARRSELMRRCSRILAVSEFIRGKVIEQGAPPDKVTVHYIGVDTDKFRPPPAAGRPPVVLFVGRLVEKKGCEYLIRAMPEVQRAVPGAELVIIGDGPLRAELEADARRRLARCRFLGAQPAQVVRDWLDRARVFSVPSITAESGDAEGFGIVFAEAQAMGVPVVSFRSGGIPEAVADGETGLLFEEKDSGGLAAGIGRLLADPGLWARMSEAGRARVVEKFDLKKQTRALEDIYGELAGS